MAWAGIVRRELACKDGRGNACHAGEAVPVMMEEAMKVVDEKGCDLLPMASLEAAAECLKVMAHPVRLRIVEILMQAELSVHEIAELCDLPAHQTCEHLRLLKGHGLLGSGRRGRSVYYTIANPRLPRLLECIRSTCGQE